MTISPTGKYRVQRDIVHGLVCWKLIGPNGFPCGVDYGTKQAALDVADSLNSQGSWSPTECGLNRPEAA